MPTFEAAPALFGATRRPVFDGLRYLAAAAVMGASEVLTQVAMRLLPSATRTSPGSGQLEFHADVGASGGALYLDGEWVAWLPGIARL